MVTKDYDRYKYWFRVTPYNSNLLVKVDFVLLDMVRKLMAKEFGVEKPKVAIVAEKAAWADPMVKVAEDTLPKMGMEVVGVWRPSATAWKPPLNSPQSSVPEPDYFCHLLFLCRYSFCQAGRRAADSGSNCWNQC